MVPRPVNWASIFRRSPEARPFGGRSYLDCTAWQIARRWSETPEFAAALDHDLRNQHHLTNEEKRVRWERWQAEKESDE